jgi:integrase
VRLLQPLAEDLRAWKPARGAIPLRNQLLFSRRDGGVWQDHDWRNLRKRVFRPAAKAAGLTHTRPYDLRGSFASLLIQEGRNVVDVAKQLGHTPETCLRYYARLFDEALEHPVPAEEAIRAARRHLAQERFAGLTDGRALDAVARAGDHHRCADLAIFLHPTEALYRTRTDDPFLTMEVLYQLS